MSIDDLPQSIGRDFDQFLHRHGVGAGLRWMSLAEVEPTHQVPARKEITGWICELVRAATPNTWPTEQLEEILTAHGSLLQQLIERLEDNESYSRLAVVESLSSLANRDDVPDRDFSADE